MTAQQEVNQTLASLRGSHIVMNQFSFVLHVPTHRFLTQSNTHLKTSTGSFLHIFSSSIKKTYLLVETFGIYF